MGLSFKQFAGLLRVRMSQSVPATSVVEVEVGIGEGAGCGGGGGGYIGLVGRGCEALARNKECDDYRDSGHTYLAVI